MRRVGEGHRLVHLLAVTGVAVSLLALPRDAATSSPDQTYIVFRCGEGYANLCGIVAETGEHRQLTFDGDPRRPGTPEYRRFHRGYHGPSLSRDGRLLSFAFEGKAYIARQDVGARVPVGKSTKMGFTSIRPDGRRLAVFRRIEVCIGSPVTGSCQGHSVLRVTTQQGAVLRRIPRVWEADWASGRRLIAARSSDRLSVFSGWDFRKEHVLVEYRGLRLLFFEPAVSPDGQLVAARVMNRDHRDYIAVFSIATGKYLRRLTSGPRDSDPEWSPDGRQVVFSRNAYECLPASPCGELFVTPSDRRAEPRSLGVQGIQPTWSMRTS